MAVGTTLEKLLDTLRSEARVSQLPAHNIAQRPAQVALLQRVQEELWQEVSWPHMRVFRTIQLQAGQRYYSPPPDIDIERILQISTRLSSVYEKLGVGITDLDYAAFDSDLGIRSDPVIKWQIAENPATGDTGQIEVWPIPASNYDATTLDNGLRIRAIKKLAPLVDDADRADLDDRLIVGFAASEMLAAAGAKDAQLKLDKVQRLFTKLKGNLTPRRIFGGMFGTKGGPPLGPPYDRLPIAVYKVIPP